MIRASAPSDTGPAHTTPTPQRDFIDSKGLAWRVFERERKQFGGACVTILVFESEASFRCIRTYADDWQSLSADALEFLSWTS